MRTLAQILSTSTTTTSTVLHYLCYLTLVFRENKLLDIFGHRSSVPYRSTQSCCHILPFVEEVLPLQGPATSTTLELFLQLSIGLEAVGGLIKLHRLIDDCLLQSGPQSDPQTIRLASFGVLHPLIIALTL